MPSKTKDPTLLRTTRRAVMLGLATTSAGAAPMARAAQSAPNRSKVERLCQWTIALGSMMWGTQLYAHHSTANFDYSKNVELDGVIKTFQWTNPHCFLQVLVPDGKGGKTEWSVEAGSPELARRLGWKRDVFKPGDKAKVIVAPMRSGGPNGTLKSVTLANGKVLYGPGNQGASLPAALQLPTLQKATPEKNK